jgi:hypothetical protein
MLITLSDEQLKIVEEFSNNKNLIIDAVAGCGKTTTILSILLNNLTRKKRILVLTYNRALCDETCAKCAKKGINPGDIYTFHGFINRKYAGDCRDDSGLDNCIFENLIKQGETYDAIIIDEAQDLRPIFFDAVKKIIKHFKIKQICLLGDWRQNIYKFRGADYRFLTLFDELNSKPYLKLKISKSFRITSEMATTVNAYYGTEMILSDKVSGIKPILLTYYKNNGNLIIREIKRILGNDPQKWKKTALLFSSPGGFMAKIISNLLIKDKKNEEKLPNIYHQESDLDEIKGDKCRLNKINIISIHGSKGLEFDYVFLFDFNETFYTDDNWANLVYVGMTRAKKQLILIRDGRKPALKFLKPVEGEETVEQFSAGEFCPPPDKNSEKYERYLEDKEIFDKMKLDGDSQIGVTDFIKDDLILPEFNRNFLHDFIINKETKYDSLTIDGEILVDTNFGPTYEHVFQYYGILIPYIFEYRMNGFIQNLEDGKNLAKVISEIDVTKIDLEFKLLFSKQKIIPVTWKNYNESYFSNLGKNLKRKFASDGIVKAIDENKYKWAMKLLVYQECILRELYKDFKQIEDYSWVESFKIGDCVKRLHGLIEIDPTLTHEFEKFLYAECDDKFLMGKADIIITGKNSGSEVYEIKCKNSEVSSTDILQTILYMEMNESYTGHVVNPVSGQIVTIYNLSEVKIIDKLFKIYNSNRELDIDDKEFIEQFKIIL